MAEVLGRHLVTILDDESKPTIQSASTLRRRLLESVGTVNLESLLNLCWALNVPVAHLKKTPAHAPHAMAISVDGRCAIVLIRNKKHEGWHLFDLAHELGHVMLGHVHPGEAIIDGEGTSVDPKEEAAANAFAFELLTGTPKAVRSDRIMTGKALLKLCLGASPNYQVDAQWLIVCVGYHWPAEYWGVCGKTLNLGWPQNDAPGLVESTLVGELKERGVGRTRRSLIQTFAVRIVEVA